MNFGGRSAIIFLFLLCNLQSVSAASKRDPVLGFFEDGWNAFWGIHQTPEVSALKPRIEPPKGSSGLDPTKFYVVSLKCKSNPDTAKLVSEGLLIKESTFVAQTLWISKTAGSGAIPSDPTKLITVFSFAKDAAGTIQDFQNDTCSETFLISGKSPVLTVSFSLTDTKNLSLGGTIIFQAAKMLVGIAPAVFAGPLAGVISEKAKAAGTAEDPLKTVVTALNSDPRRATVATNIRVGSKPTIIATSYSRIEMKVTEVSDVASLIISDKYLQQSFYDTFDNISNSVMKDITAANLRDKCGKFANLLAKNYSFNRKDSSFIFGYVAQDAFPSDLNNRLDCIGNKYNATDIVDFRFPYNKDYGALKALTLSAINNRFDHTPLSAEFARPFGNGLANLLSVVSQMKAEDPKRDEAKAALNSQIKNPVRLEDESKTIALTDADVTPDQLVSRLNDAGFLRFGCFFLKPTVGAGAFDMIMLALPLKAGSADGVYQIQEILGLRMLVDAIDETKGNGILKTIQITNDDLAIAEAARQNNNGKCRGGTRISLETK
ncbi:hypothetical protein [Bradyrhizobium sp. RDT46]|uniref:hypothetical protein n=1 Tax=Bradyrhizobium sp. RDT46 TaxID=3341829 RepID=UPI0035C68BDF